MGKHLRHRFTGIQQSESSAAMRAIHSKMTCEVGARAPRNKKVMYYRKERTLDRQQFDIKKQHSIFTNAAFYLNEQYFIQCPLLGWAKPHQTPGVSCLSVCPHSIPATASD